MIDAVLLALSLLAAHTLRYYGTSWFDLSKSIDPFQDSQWLLIVVMPFGPILLDVKRWSLALDFKILLRTVPAVILGLGAK